MCGIVGYIGNECSSDIIINGLKKLEYRGYDSAGIAFFDGNTSEIVKSVGRIVDLESKLNNQSQTFGIGHTRWATHGAATEANSHPHYSQSGLITLVHNGVIENYLELKADYLSDYNFYSQTDTEVLANLIEKFVLDGMTMEDALAKFTSVVDGSYALAIVNRDEPGTMFVAKNKSPMLIGIGDGFNMLGSDALAMSQKTSKVLEIQDKEFGRVTTDAVTLFNSNGEGISREPFIISIDASEGDKGIFDHFMLKEINEQSSVIRKIISEYLPNGNVTINEEVLKLLSDCSAIRIIAAGTSYYSGLVSQSLLEKFIQKPVHVHVASEFTYDTPIISKNDLCLFISQSGETADLRSALVKVKDMGLKTLTLTNVEGSTLAREADCSMLLHAGREIAVASTKAFIAQLSVLSILGYSLSDKKYDIYAELSKAATIIEHVFESRESISEVVKKNLLNTSHCFVLGRGVDYKVSLEGALKLKEISYIHTEGMSSGELKHGTIALIEDGTPTIFIITQGSIAANTRSNIQEVAARGANVMTITMEKYAVDGDDFVFSDISDEMGPFVSVVYMQLISYYTALYLGKDVDMPRNLAKSVTVE